MTNLEGIDHWGVISNPITRTSVPLIRQDEAISAATIDNREAYARGVEDMYQKALTAMFSMMVGGRLEQNMAFIKEASAELQARTGEQIRQRLEQLKEASNG
jgi:hypothetical protein